MKAFKIIWEALKSFYEELFYLLLMGWITVLACILIIPGPFAIGGLWYVAHRVIRGYGINFRTFWQGIKEYGLKTWGVVLIIILGYFLIYINFWFYSTPEVSPISGNFAAAVSMFWILLALIWTGTIFFFETFLIELIEPKILLALRNAASLMVLNPLKMLLWMIFMLIITVICIMIPVLAGIIPSMFAILSLTAMRTLVKDIVEKAKSDEEETESGEINEDKSEEKDPENRGEDQLAD